MCASRISLEIDGFLKEEGSELLLKVTGNGNEFHSGQIWNPATFGTLKSSELKEIVRHAAVPHAAMWSDGKAPRNLRITGRIFIRSLWSYKSYSHRF